MGALFAQRFVRTTAVEVGVWEGPHGGLRSAPPPAAATDYRHASYRRPTILLLGGERKGLPPDLQALCDVLVRIPMVGQGDSLNVAVAAGILLYAVFNQRA